MSSLSTSVVNGTENGTSSQANIRITKRKLDDAFQILDDAVKTPQQLERPSPPKKAHTIRSLYSTLAKYGIKSKSSKQSESSTSATTDTLPTGKSTPHLTAIMNRAASRTRKALPFNFPGLSTPAPPLPPSADYRPSSIPAFLSRLSTFKLATYANKPPVIDAVAASKCGWTNDGKDRLMCGLCNSSWVVAGRDGMSRDAANSLIEKQRASLVTMHKNGCPWKTRQCDSTIYRIPLQSPVAMVKDIKCNAIALLPFLQNVEVKHPLTSHQLTSLRSTISSFDLPSEHEPSAAEREGDGDVFMSSSTSSTSPVELSDSAILASLFGWALAPPAAPEQRWPTLSRAASLAATPVLALTPLPTPSLSRASPVAHQRPPSGTFTFRAPSGIPKRDTSLLHCPLCQRRVGLWAFFPQPSPSPTPAAAETSSDNAVTEVSSPKSISLSSPPKRTQPQRQFDLLKEHRSYCPYVVRSTLVPSLPAQIPTAATTPSTPSKNSSISQLNGQNSGGTLEGWRAVLTVVLRYGMGQRQRMGLDYMGRESIDEDVDTGGAIEVDGVKAMVAGVKRKGGKDLLKYVKGLLS